MSRDLRPPNAAAPTSFVSRHCGRADEHPTHVHWTSLFCDGHALDPPIPSSVLSVVDVKSRAAGEQRTEENGADS